MVSLLKKVLKFAKTPADVQATKIIMPLTTYREMSVDTVKGSLFLQANPLRPNIQRNSRMP